MEARRPSQESGAATRIFRPLLGVKPGSPAWRVNEETRGSSQARGLRPKLSARSHPKTRADQGAVPRRGPEVGLRLRAGSGRLRASRALSSARDRRRRCGKVPDAALLVERRKVRSAAAVCVASSEAGGQEPREESRVHAASPREAAARAPDFPLRLSPRLRRPEAGAPPARTESAWSPQPQRPDRSPEPSSRRVSEGSSPRGSQAETPFAPENGKSPFILYQNGIADISAECVCGGSYHF